MAQNEQLGLTIADKKAKADAGKAALVLWRNHTSTDIMLNVSFNYTQLGKTTIRGKILMDDGKPLIGFERVESGLAFKGYTLAYSTDFTIYFEQFSRGSFKVEYNGVFLGLITREGAIFNSDGKQIGEALHPPNVQIEFGNWYRKRTGSNTYPLEMNGTQLAIIWVAPNFSDFPEQIIVRNENFNGGPVIELKRKPLAEEEIWLRALAVLEITYHGV